MRNAPIFASILLAFFSLTRGRKDEERILFSRSHWERVRVRALVPENHFLFLSSHWERG